MTQVTPGGEPPTNPYVVDSRHAEAFSRMTESAVKQAKDFAGRNNVLAAPALVLACLGFITFVCAPVGAIMGHVSRSQIKRRPQNGGGFALAAIIVGWAVTVLYSCGVILPLAYYLFRAGSMAGLFS